MKKFLIITLFCIGFCFAADAQCPMCKTAVESGMEKGHTKGRGLNNGIMYLLATPYLAAATVGGIWYYKNKQAK